MLTSRLNNEKIKSLESKLNQVYELKRLGNINWSIESKVRPFSKLRSALGALSLSMLLTEGCIANIQYRSSPTVQRGDYNEIFNFSDSAIDHKIVDELYLKVANVMNVTPDKSKPRPKVQVVSPAEIHNEYLRLWPSAKYRSDIALALYIPHENKILIPYFDRKLLAHELAHYFTFHYMSVSRSKWEEIADKVVENLKIKY